MISVNLPGFISDAELLIETCGDFRKHYGTADLQISLYTTQDYSIKIWAVFTSCKQWCLRIDYLPDVNTKKNKISHWYTLPLPIIYEMYVKLIEDSNTSFNFAYTMYNSQYDEICNNMEFIRKIRHLVNEGTYYKDSYSVDKSISLAPTLADVINSDRFIQGTIPDYNLNFLTLVMLIYT